MFISLRNTLLVLGGLLLAVPQAALADDLAHAFVELSQLSFHLTDLAPGDGIAPAWSLTGGTTTTSANNAVTEQPGLFTPVVSSVGTARAFVTPSSVGAEATLVTGDASSNAFTVTRSSSQGDPFGLTLTPHTRLTIDALVSANVSRRDPDCRTTATGTRACIFVNAQAELHAMDSNHVFGNDSFFSVMLKPGEGGSSMSYSAPYTFVYENTTALPTRVVFQATADVTARLVPAVPEPPTALLWLGSLALVARLRRAREALQH